MTRATMIRWSAALTLVAFLPLLIPDPLKTQETSLPAWTWTAPVFLMLLAWAGGRRASVVYAVGALWLLVVAGLKFRTSSLLEPFPLLPLPAVGALALGFLDLLKSHPEPDRRYARGVLLLLAWVDLAWAGQVAYLCWTMGQLKLVALVAAMSVGSACAFVVVVWGLGAERRWAPWVGLAFCGARAAWSLWVLGSALLFKTAERDGVWVMITVQGPSLAFLCAAALLLFRRARRPAADETTGSFRPEPG